MRQCLWDGVRGPWVTSNGQDSFTPPGENEAAVHPWCGNGRDVRRHSCDGLDIRTQRASMQEPLGTHACLSMPPSCLRQPFVLFSITHTRTVQNAGRCYREVARSVSTARSSALPVRTPVSLFSAMPNTQRSISFCRWCKREPCFVYVFPTIFILMIIGINWIYCPLKCSCVPKSPTEKRIKLKADSLTALSLLVTPHTNNNLSLSTFPKTRNGKGMVHLHQLFLLSLFLLRTSIWWKTAQWKAVLCNIY